MPRSCLNLLRLLACLVVISPCTASAQDDWSRPWADSYDRPPRVDVSASIGFLAPTDWSDLVLLGTLSSVSGVLEQVLVRDLRIDPDVEYDGAVTYWRGRYGFRVQGGFSSSSVSFGGPVTTADQASAPGSPVTIGVDTWMYDVRGVVGLVDYTPKTWAWPYAFFGLGGITYDLDQRISPPLLTFVERSRTLPNGNIDTIVVADRDRQFLLSVDELGLETVFAFSVGIGADFKIPLGPAGLGVRVEASDHLASSPVSAHIAELRNRGLLTTDTGVGFGLVHHLRAAAGIVVQLGR